MARAATTTDVFNAVAEPRRREIIGLLSDGQEWAVGDVVVRMKLAQPAVSKHLGVLKRVGVVTAIKRGQHRMYRLEAARLKPIHDWVKAYERYWNNQIDRIKERAERLAVERIARASPAQDGAANDRAARDEGRTSRNGGAGDENKREKKDKR